MIIGFPREIKKDENRVATTPGAVIALVQAGHTVLVEKGAGEGSGIKDAEFQSAGAVLAASAEELFDRAAMICKVKEPQTAEYALLREGQILFTFLHLAAEPELTAVLMAKKVVAVAYETVEVGGTIPMLAPMSEIAGRMAIQIGAHFLEKAMGGRGVLLGGVPGVPPASVVIIGGGIVGINAARIAMGMGARVTIIDINLQRLRYLDEIFGSRLRTIYANPQNIAYCVARADLLVGAVLITGAKAPRLVSAEMVKTMAPGTVIVDVAIDQGGCVETIDRVTSHSVPTYVRYGVLHYAVPNIPGAVPRTSTFALCNATLPYVLELAEKGCAQIIAAQTPLCQGINVIDGKLVNKAVADSLNLPCDALRHIN